MQAPISRAHFNCCPMIALEAMSGSGGGGSGVVKPPAKFVVQITALSNSSGDSAYGPQVADIRTRFTGKNCKSAGGGLDGTVFDFPMTCICWTHSRRQQVADGEQLGAQRGGLKRACADSRNAPADELNLLDRLHVIVDTGQQNRCTFAHQ